MAPSRGEKFKLSDIFQYFLRGLILAGPIALTVYIVIISVTWVDNLIPIKIPGLGLVIVLSGTVILGYLANTLIAKPIFMLLEKAMRKVPLVNFIYTSINDLVKAFVGEAKRFNSPVLVSFDKEGILHKPGFITSEDLSNIGLPGHVAVYFPHSYNFSGNLFIVDKKYVKPIDGNNSEIMKYIVSGGVSGKFEVKKQPV